MSEAMTITVEVDLEALERKFGSQGLAAMQRAFARRVGEDSNYFVMVETGATRDSMALASDEEVRWDTPYARYAYYAGSAHREINPNASPKWFERAKALRRKEWLKFVEGLMQNGA